MMLHQQHQSNPLKPRNQLFTCLACQVAFPSSERQRTHYRSDWHKYNLKRKIAQLAPINAEQFAQKVLAQQTKGREEEERQGVVYECSLCRKSYSSENSFANHLSSKKHKDTESILGKEHLASPVIQPHHHKMSLFSDADDTDNESVLSFVTETDRVLDTCLFCGLYSGDFESSLDHMKLFHGFFLPDIEYLEDPKGLVMYLSEKIVNDFTCLYCNGRGKEWKSLFAVRKHMLDKGHCKMAYDESEDPEELLKFYGFEPLGDEVATHMDDNQDLVLLNTGTRLGHRQFMRYYKQRPRKPSTASSEPKLPAIEPRNRKERRQITFGTSVNHVPTTTKPQEFASRQKDFASSHRNNLVATNRLRVQNTI